MSCGYYSPHSDDEVVIYDDANNCLNMLMSLVQELGCKKYEYTYSTSYSYCNTNKWGDWYGAEKDFWYDDEVEVIKDAQGEDMCYYCNSRNLQESSFAGYKFCPDCESDILCDSEKELQDWNDSFDDYEDVSDNYDGSMEHRAIVNKYLANYKKNKIIMDNIQFMKLFLKLGTFADYNDKQSIRVSRKNSVCYTRHNKA